MEPTSNSSEAAVDKKRLVLTTETAEQKSESVWIELIDASALTYKPLVSLQRTMKEGTQFYPRKKKNTQVHTDKHTSLFATHHGQGNKNRKKKVRTDLCG